MEELLVVVQDIIDDVGKLVEDEAGEEEELRQDEVESARDEEGEDGILRQDEVESARGEEGGEPEEGGEVEELKEEMEAARESMSTLQDVVNEMKQLLTGPVLKEIALFIGKNVAIGAILTGVTVVLKKIIEAREGSGDETAQTQYQKISALSGLVKVMSEKSSVLLKWLQSNEEMTVDVGDGITVPLPDIFYKFTAKMSDGLDAALAVAKELQQKINGEGSFLVPTIDQVVKIIAGAGNFISALSGFVDFAKEQETNFPILKDDPISQEDIKELSDDLETVEGMPYA